jgi:signal transduction histidine kinase/ActR/RegA family two-component response regulator
MQMIALSCGAVLVITSTAFFAYEVYTFRQSSVEQLQTLGEAIASNSTAALAFDNVEDGAAVLAAFEADPHIDFAALYDSTGAVFAVYPAGADRTLLPARPGPAGYGFERSRLVGFQPVVEGTRRLGTLFVESDLDAMYARLKLYGLIVLVVTALATAAAWLIARRLQFHLLRPILSLTDAARAVSDRDDYSVRAVPSGGLELRLLTDTFNQMLTRIQASEGALRSQLGRLSLLQHITRAIGDRQDLQSIYQVVLCSLEDNLPIDFACLLYIEQDARAPVVSRIGPRSRALAGALHLTEGVVVQLDANEFARCLGGELVHEPDVDDASSAFPRRFGAAGLRSLVLAPLSVENRVSGVLVCARTRAQAFSSGECEFLRQLSEHVALASHQTRLYGDLQQAYDDLRQSQLAVLQQERLRALGQMASGIAHDINNAISPVALYTESLLEREPDLSERARRYLTTIRQAIEDVARTVSRMREFYRERETQLTLEQLNLNRAIRQVVDLTRPRWSDLPQQRGIVIDLDLQLAADLPDLMGAENEIRDALTNLIFNAVDAMPGGGRLILRTYALAGGDGTTAVVAEVSDTGVGMDDDTRRRCLEPFYTTKGERGTGLGLAMVYGMIQRHSAGLEIESTPGAGTTVRLTFAAYTSSVARTGRYPLTVLPTRTLRILLVDDDPLLISSLQDTLQEDGHRITATTGGQAGIDAFRAARQRDEPFDVVVTDLGMPHVDGRKVAAAIKGMSVSTPVILLTGWGQRLIVANDLPPHVDKVLSKPPRLHELRAAFVEFAP